MKAGIISLGCAKNLVDTEVILGIMQAHGITITPNPSEADILIVNTCAFIASAKEESITTILNFAEYKENGVCKSLIMAGCLGQRYKKRNFGRNARSRCNNRNRRMEQNHGGD